MGSGFSKMKKQARMMEQQFESMKNELKTKRFTGSAGNGLVSVILSGEAELIEIKIKPECVDPSDLEGLEDLIQAAHSDAFKQVEASQGSNLPSLPFF